MIFALSALSTIYIKPRATNINSLNRVTNRRVGVDPFTQKLMIYGQQLMSVTIKQGDKTFFRYSDGWNPKFVLQHFIITHPPAIHQQKIHTKYIQSGEQL